MRRCLREEAAMRHPNAQDLLPVLAAIRAAEYANRIPETSTPPAPPAPFVTISRQAGAGARTLANSLAARLNARCPGELPWTVWDNELVERVAAEHHLPVSRVAALEDQRPSWLEEALESLAVSGPPATEAAVYRRVATTIRVLAQVGRVIVVGRGGAYVTADLPGGVHVRLVAPVEHRVAAAARALKLSLPEAADWVKEKDQAREAFYRRHWPTRSLTPEDFTATFNTAAVSNDRSVESVVSLVAPVLGGGTPAPAADPIATLSSPPQPV
jgi:cytidylate kinase